jgi:hypothetical protein
LRDTYYNGHTDYDTFETILGCEEAIRLKFLRASIDQTSAIPELKDDLPVDDTFYDGEVVKWTPPNSSESFDSA